MEGADLEIRVRALLALLRADGHTELAALLAKCRYRFHEDGRLEVAGSREFCDSMKPGSPHGAQVITAIHEHFGVGEENVKAIYLPSAFAQNLPDRS